MKKISGSLIIIVSLLILFGCNGKGGAKKESQNTDEISAVPDTGYTGIKKFMSGSTVVRETSFKNGVKHGLSKSFYPNGNPRQTFWYENGLRADSAKWYFEGGQVFRTTPYKNDTIDGIQKQYYRIGKLKANLGYQKGLRTPLLEEFTQEGKLITGYPELIVNIKDDYKTKGIYRIALELTDKNVKVKYFRGDFAKGVFDTVRCKPINIIKGVGYLDLKKSGTPTTDNVGVIASILTNFGNNKLVYRKIELPYKDLK
jgi:hypothetical protein